MRRWVVQTSARLREILSAEVYCFSSVFPGGLKKMKQVNNCPFQIVTCYTGVV